MPIQREGEFLKTHTQGIGSALGIESWQLQRCVHAAREEKLLGVFGSPAFGFQEANLGFLRELPWLHQVWFWDIALEDVEGLYTLRELRYCGVNGKRPGIEFNRFPQLKTLINHWNPKDEGLAEAPVEEFYSWHFKPRSKSFGQLEVPKTVRLLELNWANPESLSGLPIMEALEELQIHRCRNLNSLAGLQRMAPSLRKLIVTTCGKLGDVQAAVEHPRLELAIVHGEKIRAPDQA